MLEAAIRTALLAVPGIATAVGDRVEPLAVAQGDALPYLTYEITGRGQYNTLADGPADYKPASFAIGVFAGAHAQVVALSGLVRDLFSDFGHPSIAGVELDTNLPDDGDAESEIVEVVPEGQESPVYLRTLSFNALYRVVPGS